MAYTARGDAYMDTMTRRQSLEIRRDQRRVLRFAVYGQRRINP